RTRARRCPRRGGGWKGPWPLVPPPLAGGERRPGDTRPLAPPPTLAARRFCFQTPGAPSAPGPPAAGDRPVSAAWLAVCVFALLAVGYRFYSRFLDTRLAALAADEPVPARDLEDGVAYVPTRTSVLWGHHFASIAGAAPIVGPAIAVIWGWAPALLWVALGTVMMGAVHDFSALVISLRHGGRSIGDIAGRVVTPRVRTLFLLIVSFLIWIVLAVFAFIIGTLFVSRPGSIFPINVQILVAIALGW